MVDATQLNTQVLQKALKKLNKFWVMQARGTGWSNQPPVCTDRGTGQTELPARFHCSAVWGVSTAAAAAAALLKIKAGSNLENDSKRIQHWKDQPLNTSAPTWPRPPKQLQTSLHFIDQITLKNSPANGTGAALLCFPAGSECAQQPFFSLYKDLPIKLMLLQLNYNNCSHAKKQTKKNHNNLNLSEHSK